MQYKYKQIILKTMYLVGALLVLILLVATICGPTHIVNPSAMIPMTYREVAFVYLAISSVPMVPISYLYYKEIKKKGRLKSIYASIFLFIPAMVSLFCTFYIFSIIAIGMMSES